MLEDNIPSELKTAAAAQAKHQDTLMGLPNVVGVGLGLREKDGEQTDKQCVTVLVQAKLPKNLLDDDSMIPSKVGNVMVDVIEVGELFAGEAWEQSNGVATSVDLLEPSDAVDTQMLRNRIRPARGGFSVGHPGVTAGTIGTACYDANAFPGIPRRYYLLSNNHVIANSNQANIGDPIMQPGRADGGQLPADQIGRLSRFIPIRFIANGSAPCNYVDAAIAEVPFHLIDREIYWLGRLRKRYDVPKANDIVQKTGRTTNFTTGRVRVTNATVDVNYGRGRVARFCRQIVTTPMSAGGDSGSIVTDRDESGVGLLFAGSSQATIMNHLNWVEALLGIRVTEQ